MGNPGVRIVALVLAVIWSLVLGYDGAHGVTRPTRFGLRGCAVRSSPRATASVLEANASQSNDNPENQCRIARGARDDLGVAKPEREWILTARKEMQNGGGQQVRAGEGRRYNNHE